MTKVLDKMDSTYQEVADDAPRPCYNLLYREIERKYREYEFMKKENLQFMENFQQFVSIGSLKSKLSSARFSRDIGTLSVSSQRLSTTWVKMTKNISFLTFYVQINQCFSCTGNLLIN